MVIITRAFVILSLILIGISILGEIRIVIETIIGFNNDNYHDDVTKLGTEDNEQQRQQRQRRQKPRRPIIRVPIYKIARKKYDNNYYHDSSSSSKRYYHYGSNSFNGRPSPQQQHEQQQQHHQQEHRRSLLQFEETDQYADGHGTHYVVMRVGNPYTEWTVTLNTDIAFTAFPCVGCLHCAGKIYEQYKSLTYKQPQCINDECLLSNATTTTCTTSMYSSPCIIEYNSSIDLSSFTATEVRDYIYLGRVDGSFSGDADDKLATAKYGFPLTFACQNHNAGWFRTHATDGYLGLGTGRASLINQMKKADKIDKLLFSLCFSHWIGPDTNTEGQKGGAMTLGSINAAFHETPIVWAENTPGPRYTLFLKRLYIREGGGQWVGPKLPGLEQRIVPVDFDAVMANGGALGGIHLDTSTPKTMLPRVIEEAFREAWKQVVGKEFSHKKVKMSTSELLNMPTILFQFKAAKDQDKNGLDPNTVQGMTGTTLDPTSPYDLLVAVPATHYMAYNDINQSYRPRLIFGEIEQRGYFGTNILQGHDVAYDLDNQRIGFAQVLDCVARNVESPDENDDIFKPPKAWEDENENIFVPSSPNYYFGENQNSLKDTDDDDNTDDDPFYDIYFLPPIKATFCHTLSCKIWIATGYVAAVMFVYVIWKCAHIRRIDTDEFGGDPFEDDFVQMGDVYDRRQQGFYPTFQDSGMRVNLLDSAAFSQLSPRERMQVRFMDPTFNWNYPIYQDE